MACGSANMTVSRQPGGFGENGSKSYTFMLHLEQSGKVSAAETEEKICEWEPDMMCIVLRKADR
ncbi:restriction enzyme type I helicase subunits [Clostridium sp. SY8519]|nr:restriction enzyme type I helicase subunits [Clostridium sp. SY8519]